MLDRKGNLTVQMHKNSVGNWLQAKGIGLQVGEAAFLSQQLWRKCRSEVLETAENPAPLECGEEPPSGQRGGRAGPKLLGALSFLLL